MPTDEMNDTAPESPDRTAPGFEELGIHATLVGALKRLKLDAPTEIQRRVIPAVLNGKDCLVRASSGVGKTNAYLLPVLQTTEAGRGLQAVVIQPTRSIALQIERNLKRFAPDKTLCAVVAVGDRRRRGQTEPFGEDAEVLIATPRGAGDLVRRGRTNWSTVRILVVDETDAILDDRGPEQLRQLHAALPRDRRTILIAGSLDDAVRALAGELLHDPLEFDLPSGPPRAASATHGYFALEAEEKLDVLVSYCKQESPRLAVVFVNTETEGRDLARRLERVRISSRWIGARRPPARRDQRGRRPERARSEVIVASDPVSRRLSTIPATHLLHYELPDDAATYMRRLEQAARLRKQGTVIVFAEADRNDLLDEIAGQLGIAFKKLDPPRRRDRRKREQNLPPNAPQPGPAAAPSAERPTGGRLSEPLFRDQELEARGVRPPRRTLGSRFRTNRRSKPLRRPEY